MSSNRFQELGTDSPAHRDGQPVDAVIVPADKAIKMPAIASLVPVALDYCGTVKTLDVLSPMRKNGCTVPS